LKDIFPKNTVNHVPLTPVAFLFRTADVHPERLAIMYGSKKYNYAELRDRCLRFASALSGLPLPSWHVTYRSIAVESQDASSVHTFIRLCAIAGAVGVSIVCGRRTPWQLQAQFSEILGLHPITSTAAAFLSMPRSSPNRGCSEG
jgi:acyl-CoA synthetase (AMP-forming)/AMP-acid ligase II